MAATGTSVHERQPYSDAISLQASLSSTDGTGGVRATVSGGVDAGCWHQQSAYTYAEPEPVGRHSSGSGTAADFHQQHPWPPATAYSTPGADYGAPRLPAAVGTAMVFAGSSGYAGAWDAPGCGTTAQLPGEWSQAGWSRGHGIGHLNAQSGPQCWTYPASDPLMAQDLVSVPAVFPGSAGPLQAGYAASAVHLQEKAAVTPSDSIIGYGKGDVENAADADSGLRPPAVPTSERRPSSTEQITTDLRSSSKGGEVDDIAGDSADETTTCSRSASTAKKITFISLSTTVAYPDDMDDDEKKRDDALRRADNRRRRAPWMAKRKRKRQEAAIARAAARKAGAEAEKARAGGPASAQRQTGGATPAARSSTDHLSRGGSEASLVPRRSPPIDLERQRLQGVGSNEPADPQVAGVTERSTLSLAQTASARPLSDHENTQSPPPETHTPAADDPQRPPTQRVFSSWRQKKNHGATASTLRRRHRIVKYQNTEGEDVRAL